VGVYVCDYSLHLYLDKPSPSHPRPPLLPSSQAMHMCDDLAEKVQEVEDELEVAMKELQREQATHKITNKQLSEVGRPPSCQYMYLLL